MFNGIIFNQGQIKKLINKKKGCILFLKSNLKLSKKDLGVSISCDGVCLTLVSLQNNLLEFYLSKETTAKVKKITIIDKSYIYDFLIPGKFKKHLIEKASILINGVSLTISKITKDGFQIWAIPHTLKLTNLKNLKRNDIVNIEIDILSKYVKKFIDEKK